MVTSGNIYSDQGVVDTAQQSQKWNNVKDFSGIMQSFSVDSMNQMHSQQMDTQNIDSRYFIQNDASMTNKQTIQTNVKSMDQFDNDANRSQPHSPNRPGTYKVSPHPLSPASSWKQGGSRNGSKHRQSKKNSVSLTQGEMSTSICTYMQNKQADAAQQILLQWKKNGCDPKKVNGGLSTVLSEEAAPSSSNITAQRHKHDISQRSYMNQYEATKTSENVNPNTTKYLSQDGTQIFSEQMRATSNENSYLADGPSRGPAQAAAPPGIMVFQPSSSFTASREGAQIHQGLQVQQIHQPSTSTLGRPTSDAWMEGAGSRAQHQYFSQEEHIDGSNGQLPLAEAAELSQRPSYTDRNELMQRQVPDGEQSSQYLGAQTQQLPYQSQADGANFGNHRSKISTAQDSSTNHLTSNAWSQPDKQQKSQYLLQRIEQSNEYLGSKAGMRMSQRTGSYTGESHLRSKADVTYSQRSAIAMHQSGSTPQETLGQSAAISQRMRGQAPIELQQSSQKYIMGDQPAGNETFRSPAHLHQPVETDLKEQHRRNTTSQDDLYTAKERSATTPACRDRVGGYDFNREHLTRHQNARSQLPLVRCQSQSHKLFGQDSRRMTGLHNQNTEQFLPKHRHENFQTFERTRAGADNQEPKISTHRSSNYTSKFEHGRKNGTSATIENELDDMRRQNANRRETESSMNRQSVINGNQVIRVNASDPTSIINSGRRAVSDSNQSDRQRETGESPQEESINGNGSGLSPVGKGRNPGDTIDISDSVQVRSSSHAPPLNHGPSVISVIQRKNKMNEESFVDLLDHSTLQMEQRRHSNIYQGLRPISKERLEDKSRNSSHKRAPPIAGHREDRPAPDTYESEYMQQRLTQAHERTGALDEVQQQIISGRPEAESVGNRQNAYQGYAIESEGVSGQGTMKVNVLGSIGNTITYQTGYSGGIGAFAEQEIRPSPGASAERGRASPRRRPASFNQTSQVAYQGNRASEHDLNVQNDLNPQRQQTQQSQYGRQGVPADSGSKLPSYPSFKFGNQSSLDRDEHGSSHKSGLQSQEFGVRQVHRAYSFAPAQSPQAPGRQEANLDNQLLGRELEAQTSGTIDSRDQRQYTESEEPSSQLLESQEKEPDEDHRPRQILTKVDEPKSILKNSRQETYQTFDSRKSPSHNNQVRPRAGYSRERHHDGYIHQADGYQNPTQNFGASATGQQLGASFKGLDSSGTLAHSNTQGHFHGGPMQGTTFQTNTLTERNDNNQASTNTLTNSMLPPRGGGGSTSKNPVIVEILKQELLSCKRQLKDQQSSNQFLKKEKFKIEHEKNLLQIHANQQQEKLEQLNQENLNMSEELDSVSRKKNGDKEMNSGYIQQLQKMNDLQAKENIIFQENQKKNENKYRREVDVMKKDLQERGKKDTRDNEKMVSQLLQMGSAAEHLKDIMRLAQVSKNDQQNQEASQKMIDYIELNFEATLKHLIKMMQSDRNKQSTSSLDNAASLETLYDSTKLEVRAQNFKKFRESTKILMQQLCDGQIQSKKMVIHNLETQLINMQNDWASHQQTSKKENSDLRSRLSTSQNACQELQKELDRVRSDTVPQVAQLKDELQSQERMIKQDLQNQYLDKEEVLQDQLIKQKYQIKEHHEKTKMLKNENTDHKIQIESMRFQISSLQKEQNQRAGRGLSEERPAASRRNNQRPNSGLDIGTRSSSIEEGALIAACKSQSKGFMLEKYKNQKLKQEKEKQIYYHVKEKQILQKQIEEYKDTVGTQSALIQELQKKLQNQNQQIQLTRQNSNQPKYDGQDASQFKFRTTQPSANDLMGGVPYVQRQNFQSQGQFMSIADQQQQAYLTYQDSKENRSLQSNQMETSNQVSYFNEEGFQTTLPFEGNQYGSQGPESQQQATWQQPGSAMFSTSQQRQQSFISGPPQRISQAQLAPITEKVSQRAGASCKVSSRMVPAHKGSKTPSSQRQFYEQTQSRTESEGSDQNSSPQMRVPTATTEQVVKAQEQVHSTLHSLLRQKKERENICNQRQQELEYQNENATGEEDEALEESESDCLTSAQNVTDVLEGHQQPRLNNQYLNIENLRAENFESLDSDLINSQAAGFGTGGLSKQASKQGIQAEQASIGQLQIQMHEQSAHSSQGYSVHQTEWTQPGQALGAIDERPDRDTGNDEQSQADGNNMTICDTNSQDSYNKDTIPLQSPSESKQISQEFDQVQRF